MKSTFRPTLLAACLALAFTTPAGAAARLDAGLALLAAQPQSAADLAPSIVKRNRFAAEQSVAATLRFSGNILADLQALGVNVGSLSGNIATVDIPLSKIEAVAALPGVIFVELAKPVKARLDAAVSATRADTLRSGTAPNWTGTTGAGVIVGVVDDGVDFRHLDFRKADGSTRLLALWDMREAASGTPPSGFKYGMECTPEMLNQAIQEGKTSTACAQPSTGNHGTHVAGIAAGNGQGTGHNQPAYRFVGMAPQADIISANAIGGGVTSSNAVIDAVNYIKAKAQAAGKPAVVNLSLGSYYGNRDGTSNYETALTNAGGKGFILTGAAGNEGDDPIRATAALKEGGSVTVNYKIPANKSGQRIEIWYPGTHQWSVQVATADGACSSEAVAAGTPAYTKDTSCGSLTISNNDINPLNDDRQILVNFPKPEADTTWQVTVSAVKGDGTLSMMGGEDSNGGVFTSHTEPVTAQILTDTCSSHTTICVGAYVTKQQWNALSGTGSNTSHGPLGDLAKFSSRGPRRDCSNLAKCPQTLKPEILAPGAMIMSTLGQDAKDSDQSVMEADGVHVAYNGTSMATPHVSGAIALLLQKNPNLTPDEVRKALFSNVQTNSYTPAGLPAFDAAVKLPNNANYGWGYGIMDVAKAFASLGGSASTAQFTATASGTSSALTLNAHIAPESGDVGKTVKVYLAALLPNNQYFVNNQGAWQPLAMPIAYFKSVEASAAGIDIPVSSGLDVSALVGTQILVGYGSDESDMLSRGKFKVIYTIK